MSKPVKISTLTVALSLMAMQFAGAQDEVTEVVVGYSYGYNNKNTAILYYPAYSLDDCRIKAIQATEYDANGQLTISQCKSGGKVIATIFCEAAYKWGDVPGCTPIPQSFYDNLEQQREQQYINQQRRAAQARQQPHHN